MGNFPRWWRNEFGNGTVQGGTEAEHYRYRYTQCRTSVAFLCEVANPVTARYDGSIAGWSSSTLDGLSGYYVTIDRLLGALHGRYRAEGLTPFPDNHLREAFSFDVDYEVNPFGDRESNLTLAAWYESAIFSALASAEMLATAANNVSSEEQESHALCQFWANIALLLANVHQHNGNFKTVWERRG